MNTIIFLNKKISKLAKESEINEKELLQLLELVTYLAATKEISLQDATSYANTIFEITKK